MIGHHRRVAGTCKGQQIVTDRTPKLLDSTIDATRRSLLIVGAFSLAINLLMLTAPLYMLQIFDRVLSSRSVDTLVALLTIAVFALAVLGGLDAVRGIVLSRVGEWLDQRLSEPVFAGALDAALQTPGSGNVQGLRDLATVRGYLSGPAILPLLDAPWMPIFLTVIFLLHPLLGWISVGGALLLFALGLANEVVTRKRLAQSSIASLGAIAEADRATRNADVIFAMGMHEKVAERWRPQFLEASAAQNSASSTTASITATSKFLRLSLQVGILSVGAWLVLVNELTPGAMIAASILMGRALGPVEQSISTWRVTVSARQAFTRLKRQLEHYTDPDESLSLPVPRGELTVENVTVFHPGLENPTLAGIRFRLEPGQSLAVIGPTAAGKTTLARTLIGNVTPRLGVVRLDDMNIAKWNRADIGAHVGYLPQDIELFSGTVADNIARLDTPDSEQVVAAAQRAGVHEVILRLPRGYDTAVGGDGASLSGGQRQRVGLARALYGNPRLVVLDEPNANLDGEGELALARALATLKKADVTVVVITQRAGLLNSVDQILLLNNGKQAGVGPRDEMLKALTSGSGGAAPMQSE